MGMRVWFENGKLKIYFGAERTEQRNKLLWALDRAGAWIVDVLKGESDTATVVDVFRFEDVISTATYCGAEISQDAKEYVEERERRRRQVLSGGIRDGSDEAVLRRAETLLERGCGLCPNLDSKKGLCKYANTPVKYRGEEVEREFEDWKEARATDERRFYAKAYPCQGCETIVEANKILKAKEKEDGKQANL